MMSVKPYGLRVSIPPNKFREHVTEPVGGRCDDGQPLKLGLSGPLRGLRSLNRQLDEALEALPRAVPMPSARNKFYRIRNTRSTAAVADPLPAAVSLGALDSKQQRHHTHDGSPISSTEIIGRDTQSVSSFRTVTTTEFKAALRENKTLREALAALRDVLFYEISKREKAESMCKLFKHRIRMAGGIDLSSPAGGAGAKMAFDKTRHYAVTRSHKQSPYSSKSSVGVVVQQQSVPRRVTSPAVASVRSSTSSTFAYRP